MRFARQATIFRGPIDPAPVVGVFFLLVIFVLLDSFLYTPGVLVKLDGTTPAGTNTVTVTKQGLVLFQGKTNTAADLAALRESDLKAAPDQPFQLAVEPGADPKLVEQVESLFQVQLPSANGVLTGTDNPTVIVAVNFRGQCFFENKLVQERELKEQLRRRCLDAVRESKKLTLVLWADKAVENEVVMRVYQIARDAGITECLMAERPHVFGAPGGRLRP